MNNKNTGRRLYEQLSAVATRKRYAAGLIAGLLLAGAAHATDIVIPAGAKKGDVVYRYYASSTTVGVAEKDPYADSHGEWSYWCSNAGPSYAPDYIHLEAGDIRVWGLGVRQVSGEAVSASDATGTEPYRASFNAQGVAGSNGIDAGPISTAKNEVTLTLSPGNVEVYVSDPSRLPTSTTQLKKLSYELSYIAWGGKRYDCPAFGGRYNLPREDAPSGGYRYPTPDGNVTLVVNNPTARTKVHNACQTGGHAGTCQRIHNFAVTHHKR